MFCKRRPSFGAALFWEGYRQSVVNSATESNRRAMRSRTWVSPANFGTEKYSAPQRILLLSKGLLP
jgi:hypothetical protein